MVHLGTFLKSCPIGGPETTKARCPLLTAIETRTDGRTYGTFSFSPHTFQDDVFAINYISIAFPMKQFSFKFMLRVIV